MPQSDPSFIMSFVPMVLVDLTMYCLLISHGGRAALPKQFKIFFINTDVVMIRLSDQDIF